MFSVKRDINDGSVLSVLLVAELPCKLKGGMAGVEIRFPDNIYVPTGVLVSARTSGDMYLVVGALGDDIEKPRFIETLPRYGYRLIAPVEILGVNVAIPESGRRLVPPSQRSPQETAPAFRLDRHGCRSPILPTRQLRPLCRPMDT